MIPSGVKVFLASHPVDFRNGPDSLLSLVRDAGSDPFNGALYVFRAKRADRVKIVWWDGSGVCLYAKWSCPLKTGHFQDWASQLRNSRGD
ncbi:IS66 family insertion sequence element accessory protein TnpB [Ochrobactrum teleogrylli]|uniref:IS66 family insertion sequence element accessory protein TnpB n=1 Tax=Ochrobactrum teleogrylli TaxID=2479765 RepID=UPI00384EB1D7